MSQSARVESLEALLTFKTALAKFGVTAQGALGSAASEIQRTLDWLHDQLKHWQVEVRKRQEAVGRAKADLMQHRWSSDKGRSRGTTDQELALDLAQRRLGEAEAKVEAVRRWLRVLPDAIKDYEGPSRQLGGMVDTDLRHSLAILDTKIAALEAYAALAAPGSAPSAPSAAEASATPGPPPQEAPVDTSSDSSERGSA